jgi:basic amino acid/polyamine antiporter, APA family
MSDPAKPSADHALLRRLGPIDAAALVVANVIGVGIFTTPGIVAAMVPHPVALIGLWVAGGLLAFAGAMAYAELAARFPRAGGEYVYLNETYGRLMGFLSGWTSFVAGFSGAIAAAAMACASFMGRFVPFTGDTDAIVQVTLGPAALTVSPRALTAVAIIAAVSAVHIRGLDTGKVLQNTLTATKVAALVLLAGIGLMVGGGSFPQIVEGGSLRFGACAAAMIPVMFSYSGWNAATYVVEEIRDPRRNVPRALALGTVTVVLIYVGVNAMYLRATPLASFGGVGLGEVAAARLVGAWAASAFTGVTIVIMLSSISAMVLAGPRVYYSMARDGLFFASASRVHPRYRTPYVATIVQALWSALLVLSGTFEQLLIYTGFAVMLFAGVAVSSLVVVRRREAQSGRVFSAWKYSGPLAFCLASLLIVVNAVLEEPIVSLTGIAVMLSGAPLYWWLDRRAQSKARGRLSPNLAGMAVLDPPV